MPEFGWVREGRVPVVCPGSTRQREELIMAELTGKAATAAALKAMVEDRKTLVDARGEAVDTHRKAADAIAAAQQAEAGAAETVRTAYTAALDGGWTTSLLNNAGLKAPKAPRRRGAAAPSLSRTRPSAPESPTSSRQPPDTECGGPKVTAATYNAAVTSSRSGAGPQQWVIMQVR